MEQEIDALQAITPIADITIPRIFISHSSEDDIFGKKLHKGLCQIINNDDAVWYDSEDGLKGGDLWWATITREIRVRPIFIVILSPDAIASKWVHDEILIAWRQKNSPSGKQIIPLSYKACKMPEELDYLHNIQHISFEDPAQYNKSFQSLLKILKIPLKKIDPLRQPSPPSPQPIIPTLNVPITKSEVVSTAIPSPSVPSFKKKSSASHTNNLPRYFYIDVSPPIHLPSSLPINQKHNILLPDIDISPPIRLPSSALVDKKYNILLPDIDISPPICLPSSALVGKKPDLRLEGIDMSPPMRLPSSQINRIREDI